jgi:hypothetical protein
MLQHLTKTLVVSGDVGVWKASILLPKATLQSASPLIWPILGWKCDGMCRCQEIVVSARSSEPITLHLSSGEGDRCGCRATEGEISPSLTRSHPLSPSFSPCLLRTHPLSPWSRDLEAVCTLNSPGRHPPDYLPHISPAPFANPSAQGSLASWSNG